MNKTILITGATDGIGLATAKMFATGGHRLLIHGRNPDKLQATQKLLENIPNAGQIESYLADLSKFADVYALVEKIKSTKHKLDVLINNAGVYKMSNPITEDGLDVRFMVNTIAPYILAKQFVPLLGTTGRIVNLSSAAQASVDIQALLGKVKLADMQAYAQSKLAITLWTQYLAEKYKNTGPILIAVNPGSLLASKMVQEGFGVAGNDINIGAKILCRMALDDDLANHSGQYFDNDLGQFSLVSANSRDLQKSQEIVETMETIIASLHR